MCLQKHSSCFDKILDELQSVKKEISLSSESEDSTENTRLVRGGMVGGLGIAISKLRNLCYREVTKIPLRSLK
jgi:hypothetical protein